MKNIVRAVKTAAFVFSVAVLTACGGGGGGDDGGSVVASVGGVCTGSGNTYNCQGRICTRAGSVVVCPDGQSCPFPANLQVTANPVCARRN